MGPHQTYLLHSKENHTQNQMTTYGLGENFCREGDQQRLHFQNVQRALTLQYHISKQPDYNTGQNLNGQFSKKTYLWSREHDMMANINNY